LCCLHNSTLTCPIEVVKTQLQSSNGGPTNPFVIAKEIARKEGAKGFFRGLSPTLIGIIPSRASYFWAYEKTKQVLTPRFGDTTVTHIFAGLAAGATGNTITNPIWMVKTRMQLLANAASGQVAYTGYRHAIQSIYKEAGIKGFYKVSNIVKYLCLRLYKYTP
jgi:Mitochondrial carrier protein